jgi:hypothetical protein
MQWLDTTNAENSHAAQAMRWERLRADLQGEAFWADRIKQFKNQPVQRLRVAIENLPLPAAFREAAAAARALIRARLKQGEDHTDELMLLYWLAAIESFGLPYSEYLKQPGFNVLQFVPGQTIKALPFTYNQLGYQQLGLLNKTDVKWCISLWEEPQVHTTLNALHADLWHEYEKVERQRQERERAELWSR